MRNFFKLIGIIALVAVIGFSMAACTPEDKDDPNDGGTGPGTGGGSGGGSGGGGNSSNNAIQLTYNTWADGIILTSSSGKQQWFKFTATEATQYIHFYIGGTLTDIMVQVYDSNGSTVGSEAHLVWYNTCTSLTLMTGQEYKIKVTPSYSGSSGTYKIGFTNSDTPPRLPFPTSAQLSADTWKNGNITSSSGEEWFNFTANAYTQYIHVTFGTLTYLNVQVYDSYGIAIGSEESMSDLDISRSLISGQVYYIKVSSSGSGTYKITFNTTSMPPINGTPTQLNANSWTSGVIYTSGERQQWFKFTATATTQYIHFSPNTLSYINVQVYDSSGSTVGSETMLWGNSTSQTLIVNQVYYIRVRPSYNDSDGTYRIGFNTSDTPPS